MREFLDRAFLVAIEELEAFRVRSNDAHLKSNRTVGDGMFFWPLASSRVQREKSGTQLPALWTTISKAYS